MNMKDCRHAHYIQAIKDGSVVKVLNIDYHGKPACRFKGIKAICKSEDAKYQYCSSRLEQQEGGYTVLPCDTREGNGDLDDESLSMTLQEIKRRRKTKKRRLLNYDVSLKQESGACYLSGMSSSGNDGMAALEEDAELEESLSCLKLKLARKLKTENNSCEKVTCTNSKSSEFVDAMTEQTLNSEISAQKIQTLESENLDLQKVVLDADRDSYSGDYFNQIAGVTGVVLELGKACFPSKQISGSIANEALNDNLAAKKSSLLAGTSEVFGDITEVDLHGKHESLHSYEEAKNTHSDLCDSPRKEIPIPIDLDPEKYTSFRQGKLSCHMESDTVPQLHDMTVNNCLQCWEPHHDGEGNAPDVKNADDCKKDISDSKPNLVESETYSHIPDTITAHTLQKLELNNGGCNFKTDDKEDDKKDAVQGFGSTFKNSYDRPSISNQIPYMCFSLHKTSDCKDYGSLKAEEKHPSLPTSGTLFPSQDIALEGSSGVLSSDALNSLIDMDALEEQLCVKKENSQKKLFPTRQAISPTSQGKLCRAVNAEKSCNNIKTLKCQEKLLFERKAKSRKLSVALDVDGGDNSMISKLNIKKLKKKKNESSPLVPRGILKVPPLSCSLPSTGSECASAHTCIQKAIKFSERQMHDIECLAIKLMKELNTMKDIVKESLSSEACQSPSLKFTADEIKSAIEDETKVEETARKWLSMMAKDCNRFCKIMKSTGKKSFVAYEYEVHKKKKKTTFADKDGGILCHVKVYDPLATPQVFCD